jgi:hypothetical protein
MILMKRLNTNLVVIWENNLELGAYFDDLFEPIKNVEIIDTLPKYFNVNKHSGFLNLLKTKFYSIAPEIKNSELKHKENVEKLKSFKRVFLETEHAFLYPEDFSAFVPKKNILNELEKLKHNYLDCPLVGLHIRRTDHTKAIENSPIVLFEACIIHELKNDPKTKFYLATDENDVKTQLIKLFANTIITKEFELSRITKSGVENAVLDLYMLSKTSRIYGSDGSSFSETAHHIGKNELILLKKF